MSVNQISQGGWKRKEIKSCKKIIAEENKKTEMNACYEEKAAAQVQWSSISCDLPTN